ncbi:MAG: hypothetical protein J0M12_04325 [Deltaproteobacteria bacterium]|nr:hypothetical protein [Deltaproteobacteria bacterium]
MPPANPQFNSGTAFDRAAVRHALASPQQQREFLPYDPQDARAVAGVGLLASVEAKTEVVAVGEFDCTHISASGNELRRDIRVSAEVRPEDVIDLIAFFRRDGKIFAAVTEVNRPALLARESEPLASVTEQLTGRMTNLPGGYITEDGPESSALSVLAQKIGATAQDKPFSLGGSILPNAGSSPELAFPYAVEIKPPEHEAFVSYGDKLDGMRVVRFMELQSIVDAYYQGALHDPRLLECTYRLAARLEYPLTLPQQAEIAALVRNDAPSEFVKSRILTPRAARELMQDPPADSSIVASVIMKPAEAPSAQPFLGQRRLTVVNQASNGDALGQAYEVDAVVRSYDTLNVGCFSLADGEPLLAVNIGVREALELREAEIRVMSVATEARNMEGVTGSISPRATDGHAFTAAAKYIAQSHTGIHVFEEPYPLSTYGFWSPGFNTSLYRECLLPFRASEVTHASENCYFMRAVDILTLADEGLIRDLALIQMARRLDAAYPSPNPPEALNFPRPVIEFLDSVSTRNQRLAAISRAYAPDLREAMKFDPLLVTTLAGRLGMRAATVEAGSKEALFFESHMETYLFHPEMSGMEAIAFLEHDSWHYGHPDRLPFLSAADGSLLRDSDGNPRLCSLSEYAQSPRENEVDALMFSEVIIPQRVGVQKFESKTGAKTVASLLIESGLRTLEEQHAAVHLMAAEGKIPPAVARFLAQDSNFATYETLLRERLIGFYVRDVLHNIPLLYKAWSEMPEVAELAIQMGAPAYNDPRVIPGTFRERLEEALRGPRSMNQLQDEIEDTRKNDLYLTILNIASLGRLIDVHAAPAYRDELRGEMREQIGKLFAAQKTLKDLLPTIRDVERSERNLRACQTLLEIRARVCREGAAFFERLVRDEQAIGLENVTELAGRKYVAFPLIPFGVPEGGQETVSSLISKGFTELGLRDPLS